MVVSLLEMGAYIVVHAVLRVLSLFSMVVLVDHKVLIMVPVVLEVEPVEETTVAAVVVAILVAAVARAMGTVVVVVALTIWDPINHLALEIREMAISSSRFFRIDLIRLQSIDV